MSDKRVPLSPVPKAGTEERRNHPAARELARLLNYYRRRKGLSILDLASQTDIPERDIRRFEKGTHAPDIPELIKLGEAFDRPAWIIAKRVDARLQYRLRETSSARLAS